MSDPADRLFAGRLRVLQYVADACVLFACTVFALLVGKNWAWGPFIVGVVVVAAAAAANALIVRVVIAAFRPGDEQLRRYASQRRNRNTVILPAYATSGVGVGLIAGSIPSYWPDVALGLLFLSVSVVVPLALLPWLKHRAEAGRSSP